MARLVIIAAALLPTFTFALGPKDPFTPPGRASTGLVTDARAALPAPPILSGVRLGKTPVALIDGEWIELGGAVRAARLVAVRLHEAVLQHVDGRIERIALFPQPTASAASAPTSDRLVVKKDLR